MALTEKVLVIIMNIKLSQSLHLIILSEGEKMKGVISEWTFLAEHLGLKRLIAIYNGNKIYIAGEKKVDFTESVADRFRIYNWRFINNIDSNSIEEILDNVEIKTLAATSTVSK